MQTLLSQTWWNWKHTCNWDIQLRIWDIDVDVKITKNKIKYDNWQILCYWLEQQVTFLEKKNWHTVTKTILVKLINDHYFTFAISESIKMALSFIDDRGTNSFSAATRRGLFLPYLLDRYMRKFLFLVYTPALTRKKKSS